MKNNLVSVIIPCYNKKDYVREAVKSAISQTYKHIEVIVVDDGSSDGSLGVLREFDDAIILKSQENQGAPAARNRGLELADGEFVKFLDADDMLARDVLERQVGQMRNASTSDKVVFGDLATINGKGEIIEDRVTYGRLNYGECAQLEDILKENIWTSCPLYRQEHLNRVGGFDEGLTKAQEYFLNLKMTLSGLRFIYKKCISFYSRRKIKGRMTSINHLKKDPMYGYRDTENQIAKMREINGGRVPHSVKEHFAQSLWRKGRRLLRLGYKKQAHTYFGGARSLHPEAPMVGSSTYRFLTSLLGPSGAERVGEVKRWLNPYQSSGPVGR